MLPLLVEVLRIEALGAETIIVAQVPGAAKPLFARFPGEAEFRIGERCQLFIDLREVHLFGEDGQALRTQ
jgi:ABC-type sugar transport system ATPase subunit